MPEIGLNGAQAAFSKIHLELLSDTNKKGLPIGFSIGVAVFRSIPSTIDEALRTADNIMYRVKRSGKNSVIYEEIIK